jgi:hypothetical protein
MKIFTIYAKGEKEVVALGDRFFDFYAFVFGPLWLAYNRMWLSAVFFAVVMMALADVIDSTFGCGQYVISAFLIACGFFSCDLLEYKLLRSGYVVCDVVVAKTSDEAELEYLRKN